MSANFSGSLHERAELYFVGIGGIGMSAAAGIAKELGYRVAGSDSGEVYEPAKTALDGADILFFSGYDPAHIAESEADVFVLSSGEDLNNPEVKYITEHGLPRMSFAELLYLLNQNVLRIVVAGTHGKSTTAGLLGHLLRNLDDSSFMAGGIQINYGRNFYVGNGHYFVLEGDEYKSEFDDPTPKFHYLKPDILVLTNLEFDHPDVFENFDRMTDEFRQLISEMPEDGLIVYNADDEALTKLVHESNIASASFGIENPADYRARKILYGPNVTRLEVKNSFSKNITAGLLDLTEQYKIQLPGKINAYNSLAAIATLRALGFSQEDIALDLLSYLGVKRRFEKVAEIKGVTIIDDYAHHATAVKQTLAAARTRYPKNKIWTVFEPHTYSRTKATLNDLATAFVDADEVLISEIYPAREKHLQGTVSAKDVVRTISPHSKNVRLIKDGQSALNILKSELKQGDVVVVMAVGSFNRLAHELTDILKS